MSDKHYSHYISFICSICFLFSLSSCTDSLAQGGTSQRTPTQQAREYWHDGEAEISSYRLNQARYGEIHDGTAVLVFVTEPFSPQHNTKADAYSPNNIPVLKLNTTKKFNTGIYPYSMMTSTFLPFEGESSSLKISSSSQEWCGMSYIEMKNKNKYEFNLNSYFEGETVSDKKIEKEILEEDLWSLIRLNPETLPTGEHHIIPSMFSLRFMHREIKPYKASISISEPSNGIKTYTLNYPELERSLSIHFKANFPYTIEGWEETHPSGFGNKRKLLTSKAELIKTIKSDYWNKHTNEDKHLRTELGLE